MTTGRYISSLEGVYDHLHTSTESLVAEEAVDSRGAPDWVAENYVNNFWQKGDGSGHYQTQTVEIL